MIPIVKSFTTSVATKIINALVGKGYAWLSGDPKPYAVELQKIIDVAIQKYEQKFPVTTTEKITFTQSATFVEQLIKYQFGLPLDQTQLKAEINSDSRIILASDEEISQFLIIFNEDVNSSETLKKLYLEQNHHELSFRIATGIDEIREKLDEIFQATQNTIQYLQIEKVLAVEWQKELTAIKALLYQFKPYTALELIENLTQRISDQQVNDKILESQLVYLKGNAIEDIEGFGKKERSSKCYIQAYTLNKSNKDYQKHAALAYIALDERDKAREVVTQILTWDEFDIAGWSALLYMADDPLAFLETVPKGALSRREFKINAFFVLAGEIETMRTVHLPSSPIWMEIPEHEPTSITYTNFRFWLLFSEYVFTRVYYDYPMLSDYAKSDELKQAPIYHYYFDLLGKLVEGIKNSEIERNMADLKFKYHYAKLILNNNTVEIQELAKYYDEISNKNYTHAIQLVQAYNLYDTETSREKALKVINDFGSDQHEILSLFKAALQLRMGLQDEAIAGYESYVLGLEQISTIHLNNLMQFFRMGYRQQSVKAMAFLQALMTKDTFPNTAMKSLLRLYVCSLHDPQTINSLENEQAMDEIELGLEPKYPEIKEFYLSVLQSLRKHERIIKFLRPLIRYEGEMKDLLIFAEALFHSQGNKMELLQVLRKARQTLPLHPILLKAEIELRRIQHDWSRMAEIAEIALNQFPTEPEFVKSLFFSCQQLLDSERIRRYKDAPSRVTLSEHGNLIIYNALLQAKLYNEATEVIYETAKVRNNIQSRQAFLSALIQLPEDTFKQYEVVQRDSYVTYVVNGKTETLYITPDGELSQEQELFLGKKVHESFPIQDGFMMRTTTINILKITNKFGALFDDITQHAANPLSGLKMRAMNFGGATGEEMRQNLQKEMGALGSMDKEHRDRSLQQYANAEISYSEIIMSVFRDNPIDGYYYLTSSEHSFFQTIPFNFPADPINDETTIILDFTTVLLFFELTKEKHLNYPHRFLISNYIPNKIRHLIAEAEIERPQKMTMTITMEAVIPHFYPEDFNEKRAAHFQSILNWVNENCDTDAVDEKLDIISTSRAEPDNNDYTHYLVDNKVMSERENHVFLSSDLFFFRTFGGALRNIVGPEYYLNQYFPDSAIGSYLLAKNYVGIQLNKEMLSKEYTAFLSGTINSYTCAVENLKVNRNNTNIRNLAAGVLFLKWLYVQSILTAEQRYRSSHYLLINMTQGLNERGINLLINMISKQFSLLPAAEQELLTTISRILGVEDKE